MIIWQSSETSVWGIILFGRLGRRNGLPVIDQRLSFRALPVLAVHRRDTCVNSVRFRIVIESGMERPESHLLGLKMIHENIHGFQEITPVRSFLILKD